MVDDGWFAVANESDEDWSCNVQLEQDVAAGLAKDWACRLEEEKQRLRALTADAERKLLHEDCLRGASKLSRAQLETRRKKLAVLVAQDSQQQRRPNRETNLSNNGTEAAAIRARRLLKVRHDVNGCQKADVVSGRMAASRNLSDGTLVDVSAAADIGPSQNALSMPNVQATSSDHSGPSKQALRMASLQAEHRVLQEAHAAAAKQLEDIATSLQEEQLLLDQFLDETFHWELRRARTDLQALECEENLLKSQLLQAERCPAATDALARALGNAAPAGMQREILRQWWYLRPPRSCATDTDG